MVSVETIASKFKAEFAGQALSMASGAVLTVGLARLLTPTDYGLLYLALSVFGVLGLFSRLGIAKSASRYVAEYRSSDPGQVPHIVRRSAGYVLLSSFVTAATLVAASDVLARALGEPELVSLLLVGSLFLIVGAVVPYVRTVLQGFERIRYCSLLVACASVAKLAFVLGFVLLGFGATGALLGYVVAYALVACVGAALLYGTVGAYDAAASAEPGLGRRILEYNVPIVFTRGSDVLDKKVDTILVAFFLSPVAVSYYVVSKQVVGFVQAPASALGFTLSPTFGSQKASDDLTEAARIYESSFVYVLLCYLPAAAGVVIVAEPAIGYAFGAEYLGAVPVLQILSVFLVFQALMKVTSNALDFLGRARARAVAKGVTAVANVALNVLLIPTFGVAGAAVATVLTYSAYAAVNLYVISVEFPLRVGYLARRAAVVAAITAAMSVLVLGAMRFVADVPTLVGAVALGVAVWLVLSYLAGFIGREELATVA